MGVVTTADNRRDEAKEHINEAYKCLIEMLDEDTWGYDQYTDVYIETVEEVMLELRRLKRKL